MIKFKPRKDLVVIDFYDKQKEKSYPIEYSHSRLRADIEQMANLLIVEYVFEFLSDEHYYMFFGGKENEHSQKVVVRLRDKRRVFNKYNNMADFIDGEASLVWDSFEEVEKIMMLNKIVYENIEYEIEGFFVGELSKTYGISEKEAYKLFNKNKRSIKSTVVKLEAKNIKMRMGLLTKERFEKLIGREQMESLDNLVGIEYKKYYEYDWLMYYKPDFFAGIEKEVSWEYVVTIEKLIKLISGLSYKKRLIVNTTLIKEIEISQNGLWTTGVSIMSGVNVLKVLKQTLYMEKIYGMAKDPLYYDFMVYISQPFSKPNAEGKKPYMLLGFQLMENSFVNMPRTFIKNHFKKLDDERNMKLSAELVFAELTTKEIKKLLEK